MALVLYTELKYKRLICHDVSILTYTGVINEENYPRVLPVDIVEDAEEQPDNSEEICNADDNFGEEVKFELDIEYLKNLDPKHWKDQDHYAVLGLQKAR